jgi:hypothetical protein
VLRARAPAALAEVEGLQAQSKFFRSLTTGIFFISYLFLLSWEIRQRFFPTPPNPEWTTFEIPLPIEAVGAIWGVSLALSLVLSILLYNRLRKNAVDETYQSAVVAFALGGRVESGASVKGALRDKWRPHSVLDA